MHVNTPLPTVSQGKRHCSAPGAPALTAPVARELLQELKRAVACHPRRRRVWVVEPASKQGIVRRQDLQLSIEWCESPLLQGSRAGDLAGVGWGKRVGPPGLRPGRVVEAKSRDDPQRRSPSAMSVDVYLCHVPMSCVGGSASCGDPSVAPPAGFTWHPTHSPARTRTTRSASCVTRACAQTRVEPHPD
jgi:hypothetical protein